MANGLFSIFFALCNPTKNCFSKSICWIRQKTILSFYKFNCFNINEWWCTCMSTFLRDLKFHLYFTCPYILDSHIKDYEEGLIDDKVKKKSYLLCVRTHRFSLRYTALNYTSVCNEEKTCGF